MPYIFRKCSTFNGVRHCKKKGVYKIWVEEDGNEKAVHDEVKTADSLK